MKDTARSAGRWIASHVELGQHPKTKRLARQLGVSLPTAIGHLHLLWWWALDFAQDGDLTRIDAADLADAAMWTGDPDHFIDALLTCGPGNSHGFLERTDDGRLVLYDWWTLAGHRLARKTWNVLAPRLSDVVYERDGRTCRWCQSPDNLTVDHITPIVRRGGNDLANLQTLCRSCNSRKGAR